MSAESWLEKWTGPALVGPDKLLRGLNFILGAIGSHWNVSGREVTWSDLCFTWFCLLQGRECTKMWSQGPLLQTHLLLIPTVCVQLSMSNVLHFPNYREGLSHTNAFLSCWASLTPEIYCSSHCWPFLLSQARPDEIAPERILLAFFSPLTVEYPRYSTLTSTAPLYRTVNVGRWIEIKLVELNNRLWESYLASLCLSFLIYKLWILKRI